jgi:hypothetical protein
MEMSSSLLSGQWKTVGLPRSVHLAESSQSWQFFPLDVHTLRGRQSMFYRGILDYTDDASLKQCVFLVYADGLSQHDQLAAFGSDMSRYEFRNDPGSEAAKHSQAYSPYTSQSNNMPFMGNLQPRRSSMSLRQSCPFMLCRAYVLDQHNRVRLVEACVNIQYCLLTGLSPLGTRQDKMKSCIDYDAPIIDSEGGNLPRYYRIASWQELQQSIAPSGHSYVRPPWTRSLPIQA